MAEKQNLDDPNLQSTLLSISSIQKPGENISLERIYTALEVQQMFNYSWRKLSQSINNKKNIEKSINLFIVIKQILLENLGELPDNAVTALSSIDKLLSQLPQNDQEVQQSKFKNKTESYYGNLFLKPKKKVRAMVAHAECPGFLRRFYRSLVKDNSFPNISITKQQTSFFINKAKDFFHNALLEKLKDNLKISTEVKIAMDELKIYMFDYLLEPSIISEKYANALSKCSDENEKNKINKHYEILTKWSGIEPIQITSSTNGDVKALPAAPTVPTVPTAPS